MQFEFLLMFERPVHFCIILKITYENNLLIKILTKMFAYCLLIVSKVLKVLCSEAFVLFRVKYNKIQQADIELCILNIQFLPLGIYCLVGRKTQKNNDAKTEARYRGMHRVHWDQRKEPLTWSWGSESVSGNILSFHCNGYLCPLVVPPVVYWCDCQLYPVIRKSSENMYLAEDNDIVI